MARILVIDDEHNVRSMIRMALEHVGHSVSTASDGPEGLEKFGDGSEWDLVLLDQRMPEMEGLDVLRRMRARDSGARVIMITAFGTIDLAVEAMKSGATDFLRKPFTPEVLRGAVRAGLAGAARPEGESPSGPAGPTFVRVTYNGFRIVGKREEAGQLRRVFEVLSPGGEQVVCTVIPSPGVVEIVEVMGGERAVKEPGRFWSGFCEQALANHLWQNAAIPASGVLRLDELTSDLKRWVESYRMSDDALATRAS